MLFFEFFPAVLAIISVIVGVGLFAANQRARNNREEDPPRTPSRPSASPEAVAAVQHASPRRPSMAP